MKKFAIAIALVVTSLSLAGCFVGKGKGTPPAAARCNKGLRITPLRKGRHRKVAALSVCSRPSGICADWRLGPPPYLTVGTLWRGQRWDYVLRHPRRPRLASPRPASRGLFCRDLRCALSFPVRRDVPPQDTLPEPCSVLAGPRFW